MGAIPQSTTPGSIFTIADDINGLGKIVGEYADGGGVSHGFLATPVSAVPEPSTLTLLGVGVIGLSIIRRRRARLTALIKHIVV